MRFLLATVGCVGLTLLCGDASAQSNDVLDRIKKVDPLEYLVGPSQAPRRSDDTRNLSAAPSTNAPDDLIGRGREISPAERDQLMRNRESTPAWGGRDRN
jgi:hypothetical protein